MLEESGLPAEPGVKSAFGATAAEIEGAKLVHDTLRQLTTLSSGAILIMATLLDRVVPQPSGRWLVAVSFAAFTVALVFAALGMGVISGTLSGRRFAQLAPERLRGLASRQFERAGSALYLSVVAAWSTFVLGMASLGAFALLNLG